MAFRRALRLSCPSRFAPCAWTSAGTAGALALSLLASTAQAQSTYTLTTLAKPSGSHSFIPTTLDNQGAVRGGMYYAAGVAFGKGYSCILFCTGYLFRALNWGAGTGASATAAVEGRYLLPMLTNDQGVHVGPYSKVLELPLPLDPEVFPTASVDTELKPLLRILRGSSGTAVLRQGGVDTDLTALLVKGLGGTAVGNFKPGFTPYGLNSGGTIVGWYTKPLRLDASGAIGFEGFPVTVNKAGVYTVLDKGANQRALPASINDKGEVAGDVLDNSPSVYGKKPALWVNGRLASVGGPELDGYTAIRINNQSQVLITGEHITFDQTVHINLRKRAALWFNGTVTPIAEQPDQGVYATAMNDQGTVTGCVLSKVANRSIDGRPFLWKNGVMLDLTAELAAKGLTLPANKRLGCPLAINNSGSLLTYLYDVVTPPATPSITWVRVNARP